jgi:hypothetical membrane protein
MASALEAKRIHGLSFLGQEKPVQAVATNSTKAGVAIFFGSVQWALVILVSEIMDTNYSGPAYAGSGNATGGYMYSVSSNYISDLGATCRGSTCTIPPSGYLFDASLVVLGLSLLVAALFLNRAFHWMPATILLALVGIGAAGAGIFPETTGIIHHLFTLVGFLSAGLVALVGARLTKKPMFYFSIVLGLVSLVALVLYIGGDYGWLGAGGMERLIAYPVIFWGASFGGHLIGQEDWPKA